MILMFGSVIDPVNSGKERKGSWEECVMECLKTWNCASDFETCLIGNPPLFGNISSSIIETNGMDFYRTEITESSENILNFNFTIHKCTKDIPKDYVSLMGYCTLYI
uniref:CW domain-containing protein n=1 Tax=Caenorhabditis tropicalis TaxID=1561998 RepID=A0A1I7UYF0_9PELO